MKNQILAKPREALNKTSRMTAVKPGIDVTQERWDPPRVLVVDDNPANLVAFEAILAEPGFELIIAQSGAEAMRKLLTGTFAAILLDINMPQPDGLETASLIRKRDRCRNIPIILVTAHTPDQAQLLRGYECGAVDYLVKPLLPEVLRYKVRVFVELFRKGQQVAFQAKQLRAVNVQLQQEMDQRRAAERDATFEREERQRVALSAIADAVITLDAGGRVTSLNTQAEQLTGWRSRAARGLALSEIIDGAGDPPEHRLAAIAAAVIEGDHPVRSGAPMAIGASSGAARYVEYVVSPVHDRRAAVVGAVLIIQDVTDRHRAELEREQALLREQGARRAAEEANQARDEFLSVISHELRTPLNAIVGWAQILQTGRADGQQMQRAVAAINRSAMAQKKLIEDLLDMSRIINGKIQLNRAACDLVQIVRAAADTVQPLADGKGVALECAIEDASLSVFADSERIQQVLWNLLSNAVKFTPRGGRVTLVLERDPDSVRIRVHDTGEGIDAVFIHQVFDAFRQADSSTARAHGGLGLGLAISRTLVAMHGGSIRASSDGPGCGACFTVVLPLPEQPASAGAGYPATSVTDSLRDRCVLVVDDDASTREMVGMVISECGAHVRSATSVREAMAVIAQWQPDVLLSDISMPGEDGYCLIARVRALADDSARNMPAVAVTAMASEEDRAAALRAGFDAHLAKPLHFQTLIDVVSTLVSRTRPRQQSQGDAA